MNSALCLWVFGLKQTGPFLVWALNLGNFYKKTGRAFFICVIFMIWALEACNGLHVLSPGAATEACFLNHIWADGQAWACFILTLGRLFSFL